MTEVYYPSEENLGQKCEFWDKQGAYCSYPKTILIGRMSCKGVIDEVCLCLKDRRMPQAPLTEVQRHELDVADPAWELEAQPHFEGGELPGSPA